MKNPFNFPQDDVERLSTQHEIKEGRIWVYRYKTTIAAGSAHSLIFRTKNTPVGVRRFSAKLTTDNKSVLSLLSFFENPVFGNGSVLPMYPLNSVVQFPEPTERVEVLAGATVTSNGTNVFPSSEQEVSKNSSGSIGISDFFLLKNNTEYHVLIQNLSAASEDYNISGVLAFVDI